MNYIDEKNIENTNCVNKVIVVRTNKEYREKNTATNKECRNNHKEALKLMKSDYYFKNKEKNNNKRHIEYHKAINNQKNTMKKLRCNKKNIIIKMLSTIVEES